MEREGGVEETDTLLLLLQKKTSNVSLAIKRVGTKGLSVIPAATEKETKMAKTLKTLEGVGDVNHDFLVDCGLKQVDEVS